VTSVSTCHQGNCRHCTGAVPPKYRVLVLYSAIIQPQYTRLANYRVPPCALVLMTALLLFGSLCTGVALVSVAPFVCVALVWSCLVSPCLVLPRLIRSGRVLSCDDEIDFKGLPPRSQGFSSVIYRRFAIRPHPSAPKAFYFSDCSGSQIAMSSAIFGCWSAASGMHSTCPLLPSCDLAQGGHISSSLIGSYALLGPSPLLNPHPP